uniref:Aldo-keto reductase n=1 Tax=Starmerella bombicola TaxID=75736 RepID=A0A0U1YPC9_STABO|nr:aldo-keto reductase [Starmerella bombicola]
MSLKFGQLQKVGYGLMGFTWIPSRKFNQSQFNAVLKKVIDQSGASASKRLFLNAGEFYGIPERHENLQLLGGFFEANPEYADKVYVSVKGGANAHWAPDSSEKNLAAAISATNKYLKPLSDARTQSSKNLDMFTLCRIGKEPIEDCMEFFNKQTFDTICLSELSAETLKRALTKGKVGAIEVEFSLFHREPLENGLFDVCVKNDIPVICYSPLGKGLLAGQKASDLAKDDMRRNFDKFKDESVIANNQKLVDQVHELAKDLKLTPAQVALSWIVSLSGKTRNGITYPHLLPIPGSTNADRQIENLHTVELNDESLTKIDKILSNFKTAGYRYSKELDKATYR